MFDQTCPPCREARKPGRYLMVRPDGTRHLFNTDEEAEAISCPGDWIDEYKLYVGEVPISLENDNFSKIWQRPGRNQWAKILNYAEEVYASSVERGSRLPQLRPRAE